MPVSGRVHAGEDLRQRRLSRTVLSDQRVRLTAIEVEVDVAQRQDRAEGLADARRLITGARAASGGSATLTPLAIWPGILR